MTALAYPTEGFGTDWLCVDEAAAICGMSPWTFREACRRGEIPNRRLPGRRRVLVSRAELNDYLNGSTVTCRRLPRGGRIATTQPKTKGRTAT